MGQAGRRVAVFDDDPEFTALMEVLLEEEGYRCLPPSPVGGDLHAALLTERPDLAIIDLHGVTDVGGLELVRAVRADGRLDGMSVLVCSADLQALRASAAELATLPRVGVLEKPFRIDTLLGAMERLLAGAVLSPPVGGEPDARAVAALEDWLAGIGRTLRWDVLDAWVADRRPGQLRCAATWSAVEELAPFVQASQRTRLPFGAGLPGRIWVSGRPAWIDDLASDMNFPRLGIARRLGLVSAAAVPALDGGEIVGVLAGYARRRRRANAAALARLRAATDGRGPTFRAASGRG